MPGGSGTHNALTPLRRGLPALLFSFSLFLLLLLLLLPFFLLLLLLLLQTLADEGLSFESPVETPFVLNFAGEEPWKPFTRAVFQVLWGCGVSPLSPFCCFYCLFLRLLVAFALTLPPCLFCLLSDPRLPSLLLFIVSLLVSPWRLSLSVCLFRLLSPHLSPCYSV